MKMIDLEPKLVWGIFDEITKVPRPSKKEGKIREYLLQFAEKHNLEAKADKIGNVIIYKPATPGFENAPVTILQGHMDMVCEKELSSKHDFENDPIETVVDGDWVRTKGTTLGADNGIGVATSLAALVDDSLQHGPLRAIFTVDEETGLTGAMNMDPSFMLGARYLLNLDSEDMGEITLGCAGGIETTAVFDYTEVTPDKGYFFIKVYIRDLIGGHSGCDIEKGRACATKIVARFLYNLDKVTDIAIAEIGGGTLRNAIARNAEVTVGVPMADKEKVVVVLNELQADLDFEYKDLEHIHLTWESVDTPDVVMDARTTYGMIRAIYAAPHGVQSMSRELEGLVESSTNLAYIRQNKAEKTVTVATSQRCASPSRKHMISDQIVAVFEMAGANTTVQGAYPGWIPNPNSQLVKTSVDAYRELFHEEPKITATHGGLECGYFTLTNPGIDMVSFGPTIVCAHSTSEALQISTVGPCYDHLALILKKISQE